MKKLLLFILLFSIMCINAQDIIYKLNGEKVKAKILEIGTSEVEYKKMSNLEGPVYIINTGDIKEIVFENGEKEIFSNLEKVSNHDSVKIPLGKGEVYFIRHTGKQANNTRFNVFKDEELVVKIREQRYTKHYINPGKHLFTVQMGGKSVKKKAREESISIDVEEGKTYYIQLILQLHKIYNDLYCKEITKNAAEVVLVNCIVQD